MFVQTPRHSDGSGWLCHPGSKVIRQIQQSICYLFRKVAIGTATISAALSDRRMQMKVRMAATSFSRFSNNELLCPPGRLAATISERFAVVSESDAEKEDGIVVPRFASTPSKTLLARSPKNAPVTYFSKVYFPGRREAASNSQSHSVLMKSRQPEWKTLEIRMTLQILETDHYHPRLQILGQ